MKTELIYVGKQTDRSVAALIQDYAQRINHYMPFGLVEVPDLKNARHLSEDEQCQREGMGILQRVEAADVVVLLDERGKEMRSMEFAQWLQKRLAGGRKLSFVIGGAYGFSPDVYARANDKVSISKMTFTHQMVRLIFVEQLYRACTILKGEKYHHE